MRRAARLLGLVAAVALVPACSRPGPEVAVSPARAAEPIAAPAVEPAAVEPAVVEAQPQPEPARFAIGAPAVHAVRAPAELPEEVRSGIEEVLDRYLNLAMVEPLRRATPVDDLSGVFRGGALERATGPDRGALVDDGFPRVARLHVGEASARLTALVGPGGVAVVAADVHVVLTGAVVGGAFNVDRAGELELRPGDDGWRVTGYSVTATRSGPDGVVTTTTAGS